MYEQFYGLSGTPFRLPPDHSFFYESSVHKKAASYLLFGLESGEGFIVITGDVGAGKTTLMEHLLAHLDEQQYAIARIVTSQLEAEDLLRLIARAFGLPGAADKATLLGTIEDFLTASSHQGRRCLLFIDEVQNLSVTALEELRMLSNLQSDGKLSLQSFLVGQPQFRRIVASKNLDQFRQRVIASYHLGPMNEEESAEYIRHRLRLSGWTGRPDFTSDCMKALFRHSGGIPRRLNLLASRLMLLGFLDSTDRLDGPMVDKAADELTQELAPLFDGEPTPPATGPSSPDMASRLDMIEDRLSRQEKLTRRLMRILAEDGGGRE